MAKSEKDGKSRRELLTLGSAFGLMGLAAAGTGGALFKYMMPVVSYGTPQKFLVPVSDLPDVGDELVFDDMKVVVRRQTDTEIAAISLVCTHLGCTPNWLEGEQKFKCPCHGSGFYITGINFEGPAPRPLERVGIRLAEDGMLEVDKSVKFQEELGQWSDSKSYEEV